jgi:hypothetical protein
MKEHFKLFMSSTVQIFLVSCNTYLIANSFVIPSFFVGFLLSFIWSYNIKRIAISTQKERIIYCLGAGTGTSLGVLLMSLLKELLS